MNWEQLIGPGGLAIAACLAVVALWRNHTKSDELKDETIKTLTDTVAAFPPALNDLTKVVVAADRRERGQTRET